MKKRLFTVIMIIALSAPLTGCLDGLREKILGKAEEAKTAVTGAVEAAGEQYERTKMSVEQKIDETLDAANKIQDAANAITEAADAVKQVGE